MNKELDITDNNKNLSTNDENISIKKNSFPNNSSIIKYNCNFCNKQFLSLCAQRAHIKYIHEKKNVFYCSYPNCNKLFRTKYRLETHIKTHEGIKSFKCEICDKSFTESGTLLTHYVIHSNYKPFSCEYCAYKCKTNPQLKYHYLKHHYVTNFYKCSKCGIRFKKKAELKHHFFIQQDELNIEYIEKLTQNIETEFQKKIQNNNNNNEIKEISNEISFDI